jgi:hypothetical protein
MKASFGLAILSLAGLALATASPSPETADLEERTFTVSVGAMLEAPAGARLARRSDRDLTSPLIERALGREVAEFSLDERGNVVFPDVDGARRHLARRNSANCSKAKKTVQSQAKSQVQISAKKIKGQVKKIVKGAQDFINQFSAYQCRCSRRKLTCISAATITWYTGHDLLNVSRRV